MKSSTSPASSLSPFLSTRKRKSKPSPEEHHSPSSAAEVPMEDTAPKTAPNSSRNLFSNTQVTQSSEYTAATGEAACTPAQRKVFATPFTFLSTGAPKIALAGSTVALGRRTKSLSTSTNGQHTKVVTAADALWEGEGEGEEHGGRANGFDGENPFGTQVDDGASQIGVYRPVYAEDGFIEARSKPKLQVLLCDVSTGHT